MKQIITISCYGPHDTPVMADCESGLGVHSSPLGATITHVLSGYAVARFRTEKQALAAWKRLIALCPWDRPYAAIRRKPGVKAILALRNTFKGFLKPDVPPVRGRALTRKLADVRMAETDALLRPDAGTGDEGGR